jgi:hypothetical protein
VLLSEVLVDIIDRGNGLKSSLLKKRMKLDDADVQENMGIRVNDIKMLSEREA